MFVDMLAGIFEFVDENVCTRTVCPDFANPIIFVGLPDPLQLTVTDIDVPEIDDSVISNGPFGVTPDVTKEAIGCALVYVILYSSKKSYSNPFNGFECPPSGDANELKL